jgi:hypothetical protein
MLQNASSQFSDITQWCSYYCEGNPAEHRVTFKLMGEEFTQELCDYCLEEFLDKGPR